MIHTTSAPHADTESVIARLCVMPGDLFVLDTGTEVEAVELRHSSGWNGACHSMNGHWICEDVTGRRITVGISLDTVAQHIQRERTDDEAAAQSATAKQVPAMLKDASRFIKELSGGQSLAGIVALHRSPLR